MNIETYRYLMSALIQVFGTLIISDAIFYLFRLEILNKQKEFFRKQIAIIIQMMTSYKKCISEWSVDYKATVSAAESIAYLNEDEFKAKVEESEKCLISSEYYGDRKADQLKFDYYKTNYKNIHSENTRVKRNIAISMIILASISIINSLCLAITDMIPLNYLFLISLLVMVLATIGFISIIYFALNSLDIK